MMPLAPGKGEVWACPGLSERALEALGHEIWHVILGAFHREPWPDERMPRLPCCR